MQPFLMYALPLLAEGSFKVIPLSPEKFKAMIGIDELPKSWADWLGDGGS